MDEKIREIEKDIQPHSYLNSFKAIEHIKYLLSRIKELEYIMTCDPALWDSAYVKWATEKAEARIKELVEGIQGILNQKNLMSFTIQKQLEKLITRKCPKCDGEFSFDEVDIGVGTMQGNYRCNACGWSDQDVSYLKEEKL